MVEEGQNWVPDPHIHSTILRRPTLLSTRGCAWMKWRRARRKTHAKPSRGAALARLGTFGVTMLPLDPEKWMPVFPRDKREAFARRSYSIKKIERDDDSTKSHPALEVAS